MCSVRTKGTPLRLAVRITNLGGEPFRLVGVAPRAVGADLALTAIRYGVGDCGRRLQARPRLAPGAQVVALLDFRLRGRCVHESGLSARLYVEVAGQPMRADYPLIARLDLPGWPHC